MLCVHKHSVVFFLLNTSNEMMGNINEIRVISIFENVIFSLVKKANISYFIFSSVKT